MILLVVLLATPQRLEWLGYLDLWEALGLAEKHFFSDLS